MEKDYQKLYYHSLGRIDGTLDLLDVALGIMKDGTIMMKKAVETNNQMIVTCIKKVQDVSQSNLQNINDNIQEVIEQLTQTNADSLNAAMEMINQSCLRFDLLSRSMRNIQQKDAAEHGLDN